MEAEDLAFLVLEIQLSFFNYHIKNVGEFNPNLISEKFRFMIIEKENI